jgi:hypothetical protein
MSAAFLASIVDNAWVRDSGLGLSIMWRGLWRRDDVPRAHSPGWPRFRVKSDYADRYRCTFITHFSKAAIEALREPGDSVDAPLGLLHGFPCYLRLDLGVDGLIGLRLFSDFLDEEDDPLDMTGEVTWAGMDKDEWRGFEFTVVRGTVGAIDLEPSKVYETGVCEAHWILKCAREALVYDADNKLKVELELKVFQHKDC